MTKIGKLPEFTTEEGVTAGAESAPEQIETPAGEETPSEAATENEPSEVVGEETKDSAPEVADNTSTQSKELQNEIVGLRDARKELLDEIKELRGERRELKQREIDRVEQKIEQKTDDLKDLHPDDVTLIDRVLRAKGYVSQPEVNKMLFEAKKQDVLNKFLREFPEYKPENDPDNKKWGQVLQEISLYREPTTADQYETLLRRAHRMAGGASAGGQSVAVKKHQVQVASAGSAATRKPSSTNKLSQLAETHMQGYSQEEIAEMQKRLANR